MGKIITASTLALLLAACAASEDSSGPDWVAGIYTGNFTPANGAAQPSVVMITSDKRALYLETDLENAGLGTASGSSLNFGAQASISLTEELSGTYVFGSVAGNFSLAAATDIYNYGSSTATLDGTYIDDTYTSFAGTTTWVFANGAFSLTSTDGCTAYGTVTPIDTAFNEYTVNMTIQDCVDYDGIYTGLGFTDDTNATHDTINMLVQNEAGSRLIFSAPVHQ